MGFFDFLKSLLKPAPKRDISRLETLGTASPGNPNDAIREVVDLSGRPLKDKHLRRALRDKRLLPKTRSIGRSLGFTKRKKVMSKEAAERLFGSTLRTRNRNQRDLLADEEQLRRYGLPLWKTEADVAEALGISHKQLWYFAMHRQREQQPHYITFAIPKRSGGKRLIMAPKRQLKAIQRKLLDLLVSKLPVSQHAHAFREGRNIRAGAEPHVGKRVLVHLDLKDFFPSVSFARVRGLLVAYGYSFPVASTLAVLMTEAERQPVSAGGKVYHVPIGNRYCVQGAPTSPGLCNALVLRLDRRLAGLAKKRGFQYTRYADDLTFSGDVDRAVAQQLRIAASRIIREEGFEVNPDKTKIMGRASRQAVTNVVVNEVVGMSRQDRRLLRAAAHRLKTQSDPDPAASARLEGYIAYLSMLNAEHGRKLQEFYQRR